MERRAALAGHWYPGDEASCRDAIVRHSAGATALDGGAAGLIGPHAGWFYCGDVLGAAYAAVAAARPEADLVVVFGGHRSPSGPNTVFRGTGWRTPLGPLATSGSLADAAAGRARLDDEPVEPRRADNAVEIHLPFVKHHWPDAELLVVGVAASAEIAVRIGDEIGQLVAERGRNAVFVGSTDLTHYGPAYDFAPAGAGPSAVRWVREVNDVGFLERVVQGDPEALVDHAITHGSACCPGVVAATLRAVGRTGEAARPRVLDHTLSCDVQPGPSFVGYAGIAL